jgi:ABC-2 type transport system ATP-binding protein
VIEVLNLTKSFGGRPAIKGVAFKVEKGEILGFLGPNGAGKTTTMRILTCYMPPDAGTARVDGFDVFEQSMEVRRRTGYLPENPPLYNEMVVRSFLDFVAKIRGVPKSRRRSRVDAAIERCGLRDVSRRLIGNLSKGYRQRVGLAQAILHDPPVLVLDEPTVGLDPEQIIEIRSLIRGLGGDHTIILSTHILPEVTVTCSRVAIISYGEIVLTDRLDGLAEAAAAGAERIRLRVARDGAEVAARLGRVPGVASVHAEGTPGLYEVRTDRSEAAREAVAAAAVGGGFGLLEMAVVTRTLEEIYLEATRRLPAEPEPAPAGGGGGEPAAAEPAELPASVPAEVGGGAA